MKTTYKGFEIEIDRAMKFEVSGEGWPEGHHTFDSVVQAKEAIDEIAKVIARQRRAEAKTSTPVLVYARVKCERGTFDGVKVERVRVKGIHGNTSKVLFDPPTPIRAHGGDILPDVPWVEDLMRERVDLEAKIREIDVTLRPYATSESQGYGQISSSVYPQRVADLTKTLKEKLSAASASGPK